MSQQLKLREAVPKDAQDLLDFLKKVSRQSDFISFDDIQSTSIRDEEISLDAIFQSEYDELILAVLEDELIGYCRLERIDTKKAEFGVVVDKEFWNNGIASYLLEEAIDWANASPLEKIILEVYKNNSAAIHIYQKYGFTTELTKSKTIVMSKMVK
ncbi:GNAT family N-acetyltransferase [Companilactobacillus futsaii]|uniref:GNAT family N-acetyltransferase n=2 Tax=Companilactobacillus futsaii TaxID=938155 RepID=A0A5B7T0I1_9LACO|nr:GNAT family N-acetyltransferase [Companilactobacillus futsaii]KRK99620.1 acetyltransferase, gnat family protein [Companilactobacillus futsaii JCM 17355]QCX25223.1 GNAT family N-acetyltransferase [Companilactobacillus futsaii]